VAALEGLASPRLATAAAAAAVRIGLDVSSVAGQRTGGGRYAYQLARGLAAVDRKNRYLLYPTFYYLVHPEHRLAPLPEARNMRTALRWLPPELVTYLWRVDRPDAFKERLLGGVDLVHSTTYCAPLFRSRRKRLVVTIYDLTFVTHPEYHLPANVAHCLEGTRLAIERADMLIAISESVRRDLIERMHAPAERIVVTPLAADPRLARVTDPTVLDRARRRYRLPERFVLFLGAMEPRKNLLRLIEAWAALKPAVRRETALVVAGAQGWLNDSVRARVETLELADRVHLAGYVEDEDLAALYSLATVFAYPSLWEGFGLPVLEAMACGTPVLTSDISSLPEVAGAAAVLVPPTDVEAIADGLLRLLEDAALRADLTERGRRQAGSFSWERCARETLSAYNSVVR
jgi:glycosyltransferase involved in cell wall biosynthesis